MKCKYCKKEVHIVYFNGEEQVREFINKNMTRPHSCKEFVNTQIEDEIKEQERRT